jgi:hypothetical protein
MTRPSVTLLFATAAVVLVSACNKSSGDKPAAAAPTPPPAVAATGNAAPALAPSAAASAAPTVSAEPAATPATPPTPPVPAVDPAPVTPATTPATKALAQTVPEVVPARAGGGGSAAPDLVGQLLAAPGLKSDAVLSSVAGDLGSKVAGLGTSLASQPATKEQLDNALKSLASGREVAALDLISKVSQARLTPEQAQAAMQVKDLATAYAVQRNFNSIQGAQDDVAQVVSGLRKGEVATVVPAVQKVLDNGKLTDPQRQLLTDLADRYAPGFKNVSETLTQGLKSIKGLGK